MAMVTRFPASLNPDDLDCLAAAVLGGGNYTNGEKAGAAYGVLGYGAGLLLGNNDPIYGASPGPVTPKELSEALLRLKGMQASGLAAFPWRDVLAMVFSLLQKWVLSPAA